MSVRVTLIGASGRMGRAVLQAALDAEEVTIVGATERPGSDAIGSDLGSLVGRGSLGVVLTSDLATALAGANVAIDFTTPASTAAAAEACLEARVAAVIGTTGLDERADTAIDALAARAPVVVAPNMSPGVTLFFHLAARAAELLGPDYDAEIVEMHHRRKVDAPSGTAVRLGEVVARAKGFDPERAVVHGRSGQVGARPREEVGIMTLRGGDVIGDHSLVLAGEGERLELTHRAGSRDIFARGAVRAARWVVGQPPGRYDMADVMGIAR